MIVPYPHRSLIAPASIVLVLLMAGSASAQLINASDDTWVREDIPNSNRNGDACMNCRTDGDDVDNEVIFLKFDTTGMTTPVTNAKLILTWCRSAPHTTETLSLYGLNDGAPGELTWSETTLTYNNAPGMIPDGIFPGDSGLNPGISGEVTLGHTNEDVQDLDIANVTVLATQPYGPQVEGATYSFSSAALDAFINNNFNNSLTFLITRGVSTSNDQPRFMSKDATSSQSGVVTGPAGFAGPVLAVPEPTTLALIAVGGVVGMRRRQA